MKHVFNKADYLLELLIFFFCIYHHFSYCWNMLEMLMFYFKSLGSEGT